MKYEVSLTPRAAKYLHSLQKKFAGQIIERLEALADEPRPRDCVKLKTSGERYRIKSGNYRIIYEVRDNILLVLIVRIDHRQGVYDKLKRSGG